MTFSKHPRLTLIWISLLLVAAVYLVTLAMLERDAVWVADNGNKLIQLRGILRSNYRDYSIELGGSEIDPGLLYSPIQPPFAAIKEYKLYSIFSPVFATISTFPYRVLGYWGLYVIPCLSTLIMLFGLVRIMDLIGAGRASKVNAVIIAGLCTPVWFYSVVFWEHSIAGCLGIWSVLFCLRFACDGRHRDLITAAVFAASAAYFRDEFYVFGVLLALLVAAYARGSRYRACLVFLSALILSFLPLWVFQWWALREPFGFHLETHLLSTAGLLRHIMDRPRVLYNLFAAASARMPLSIILTFPYVLLFILNPRLSRRAFRLAVPALSLIALTSSFFVFRCYFQSDMTITCMATANSLFPAAPLLILALVRRRDAEDHAGGARPRQMVYTISLGYALLYGLAAPLMGSWGIHWGNRLLFILYPLLAIPCALNLADWRKNIDRGFSWRVVPVAALVLLSLGAQAYSIDILERKKRFNHEINQEAARYPGCPIVTDAWWVGQELHTQFYQRMIFRVTSVDDYAKLLKQLSASGYDKVLVVTPSLHILSHKPAVAEVTDNGLNFWYLRFFEVDTGEAGSYWW
jgi:hypothetical protein